MPVIEEVHDDGDARQGESPRQQNGQTTRGASGFGAVISHMMSNKIETALWLARLCTVFFTVNFLFPFFGTHPFGAYQKTLLSSAITSALRLHQRLPNFQFSREFFGRLFIEDSTHYLFYTLIFVTGYPVTMTLIPLFLYALLHAQSYTKQLLNLLGPDSVQFLRSLLGKLEQNQINILRFIACSEIFLMPALLFMIFGGQVSIITPFLYYRFLSLRYSSQRNPYCRTVFYELRISVETLCARPQCPQFIRGLCYNAISLISRLAPTVPQ